MADGKSWGIVKVEGYGVLYVANDAGKLLPVLDGPIPLIVDRLVMGARSQSDALAQIRRVLKGCGIPEADLPQVEVRIDPRKEEYFRW